MDIKLLKEHFPQIKFEHYPAAYESQVIFPHSNYYFGFEADNLEETHAYISYDYHTMAEKTFPNTPQGQLDAIAWVKDQFKQLSLQILTKLNIS